MRFDLHQPCDQCPFLRSGGVRLRAERIEEIVETMLCSQGGTFTCHKTLGARREPCHCAGALIFMEKHDTATQIVRIMERLGMYDRDKLRGHEKVFDNLEEMLETAI